MWERDVLSVSTRRHLIILIEDVESVQKFVHLQGTEHELCVRK
jgi:hypothetical protein